MAVDTGEHIFEASCSVGWVVVALEELKLKRGTRFQLRGRLLAGPDCWTVGETVRVTGVDLEADLKLFDDEVVVSDGGYKFLGMKRDTEQKP